MVCLFCIGKLMSVIAWRRCDILGARGRARISVNDKRDDGVIY